MLTHKIRHVTAALNTLALHNTIHTTLNTVITDED